MNKKTNKAWLGAAVAIGSTLFNIGSSIINSRRKRKEEEAALRKQKEIEEINKLNNTANSLSSIYNNNPTDEYRKKFIMKFGGRRSLTLKRNK